MGKKRSGKLYKALLTQYTFFAGVTFHKISITEVHSADIMTYYNSYNYENKTPVEKYQNFLLTLL